jgi:hypothetical protein
MKDKIESGLVLLYTKLLQPDAWSVGILPEVLANLIESLFE